MGTQKDKKYTIKEFKETFLPEDSKSKEKSNVFLN